MSRMILLVTVTLAFTACGSVSQGSGGASSDKGAQSGETGGSGVGSSVDLPTSSGGSGTAGGSETLPDDFDQKIIKTAELGIRAKEVRESASEAQQVAARFGGSVLSSRVEQGGDSVYADLVLTIPSEEFEKALDELRGLGRKVTTDSVSGQDVTDEYVDLESRERNLLAAEESLIKLYDQSESVNNTLRVQRELTNVRGEIELVQGRLKFLDQRTAFSQVSLSIQPLPGPSPAKPGWSPATVAAQAWDASLLVLRALATALISVIVFGWWLVPVLVAVFLWWRWRSSGPAPDAS